MGYRRVRVWVRVGVRVSSGVVMNFINVTFKSYPTSTHQIPHSIQASTSRRGR